MKKSVMLLQGAMGRASGYDKIGQPGKTGTAIAQMLAERGAKARPINR